MPTKSLAMNRAMSVPAFYTVVQRRLHWLVIILLAMQYLLQGTMREALTVIESGQALGIVPFFVTIVHTFGGMGIGAMMLWRWQLRRRAVPLNGGQLSELHQRIVQIHHVSLYVVTGVMVLSGAMHYYLEWQFAQRWHGLGKWFLAGLVSVHIAGALWHARRDSVVLSRMMGRMSLR